MLSWVAPREKERCSTSHRHGRHPWLHHTRLAGLGVNAAKFCFPGRPTVCVRLVVLMMAPQAGAISCCSSSTAWPAQTSNPAGARVGNAGHSFMVPARPTVHVQRAGGTRLKGFQTSLCKLTTARRPQTSRAGDGVRIANLCFLLGTLPTSGYKVQTTPWAVRLMCSRCSAMASDIMPSE